MIRNHLRCSFHHVQEAYLPCDREIKTQENKNQKMNDKLWLLDEPESDKNDIHIDRTKNGLPRRAAASTLHAWKTNTITFKWDCSWDLRPLLLNRGVRNVKPACLHETECQPSRHIKGHTKLDEHPPTSEASKWRHGDTREHKEANWRTPSLRLGKMPNQHAPCNRQLN